MTDHLWAFVDIRDKRKATLYHCTFAMKNATLILLSEFPLFKVIRVSSIVRVYFSIHLINLLSLWLSLRHCVVGASSADALRLTNGCICRLFVESVCCVEGRFVDTAA